MIKIILALIICYSQVSVGFATDLDPYILFTVGCASNQFECQDGTCIPNTWLCDNQSDCKGGKDEVGCVKENTCKKFQYRCANNQCIHNTWICDGETDCPYGDDEQNCPSNVKTCGSEYYQCSNGYCVHNTWICDGEADCSNGEDESNCSITDAENVTATITSEKNTTTSISNDLSITNQSSVLDVNGCECSNYTCSCCAFLHVPKINLNETGCVIMSYLRSEVGFDMKLTLNQKIIIEEKVSLQNPPPLCVGIPYLHHYGSLCVVLYNVTYSHPVGACLRIEAKLVGSTVEQIDLGCFHMHDKVQVLTSN